MKSLLACAIIIGLVILGPAPASICSLLSSMAGECATPASRTHCDDMDMATPSGPTVAAPSSSCCLSSQAPLPESRNETAKITVHQDLGSAPQIVYAETDFNEAQSDQVPQVSSSPPLQPLLCTFLI